MRVPAGAMILLLLVSACGGGSGSNPFGSLGSFGSIGSIGSGGSSGSLGSSGGGQSGDDEGRRTIAVADDDSILLNTVDKAVVEPALRGAILRVTSIAPTQGYHSARLAPLNRGEPDEDGIITYELRAVQPETVQATGPARTRTIVVAAFLDDAVRAQARAVRIVSRGQVVEVRP